jgi:hypothetical protein
MNFQLLDQETTGGLVCGYSFASAKPKVLCRTPDKVLLLIPGYSSYVCRMGQTHSYSPTALWRFLRREDGFRGAKKIVEGGRFSNARLREVGDAIDAAMGEEGLWRLLDVKKTLVLGECEPFNGAREGYWGPRKLGWGVETEADRLTKALQERKGI